MMECDVIVAGGGPAGSTVGSQLAQRGYSVLILEKETFPRNKVCAGGLPRKILKFIDLNNDDVVEDRITSVEFNFRNDRRFVLQSNRPLLYTVRRDRFDDQLLQRARDHGCLVREGEAVRGLGLHHHRVMVRTPAGAYASRVLVGADGVTGVVSRLGRFHHRRQMITTLQ